MVAECYGYGVGGVNYCGWEDEEVGDVGEEVGYYYEGEGGVDYAWEIAGGVYEFACYVVDLFILWLVICAAGGKGRTYIVPSIEGP